MNCIKLYFYFDLECWYYYVWGRCKFKYYEIKIRLLDFKMFIKEWCIMYDNKNIYVYWWIKLFMMSICMVICMY